MNRICDSLRVRMILLASIAFAPVLVIGIVNTLEARRQALEGAHAIVLSLARLAETRLHDRIANTRHLLLAMAADPVLRGEDMLACSAALAAQAELDHLYAPFLLASQDGKILCRSDPGAPTVDLSSLEHFRRALESSTMAIGKPLRGRVSKRMLLPVAQRLTDARGRAPRVLIAGIDLASLGAEISSSWSVTSLVFTISDEEGRVLYRHPDNERWAGSLDPGAPINRALLKRQAGEAWNAVGLDGVRRIHAFADLRDSAGSHLVLRVGAPLETLTADVDHWLTRFLVFLALIVGLALWAMLVLSMKLVHEPVLQITAAAERLAKGELSTRIPQDTMRGELRALAGSFNRMARQLNAMFDRALDSIAEAKTARNHAEALLEGVPDAIVIVDSVGRIVLVNSQAEKIFGYGRSELLGEPVEKLMPERFRATHHGNRQSYANAPSTRAMGAGRVLFARRADGTEFPVDISLSPFSSGQGTLIISTVRDVTDRVATENALRESARRFRSTLDNMMEGAQIIGFDWHYVYVNAAAAKQGRSSVAMLLGRTMMEAYPGIESTPMFAAIKRCMQTRQAEQMESDFAFPDGRVDFFQLAIQPVLEGVFVLSLDITERVQARRRTQAQLAHMSLLWQITRAIDRRHDPSSIFQAVLRNLEDSLPIDFGCIFLIRQPDQGLRLATVGEKSAALVPLLGLTDSALIDVENSRLKRCLEGQWVHEPDVTGLPDSYCSRMERAGLHSLILTPLLTEGRVFGILVVARRQPRSFSAAEVDFLLQMSENVGLAVGQAQLHRALQDAYDNLRQTQRSLVRHERLRALGEMASGIAHDINNAISPISLYTDSLLEREPNLSERGRTVLQTIRRAVQDVTKTIARMREFYRPREPQLALKPVRLNRVAEEVLELTRARWSDLPQKSGCVIRTNTELDPDLPEVMGIENEIREALTNLVFNAVDAMPEGGMLTLRTRATARGIVIKVRDTGVGMDKETRRRCLEPFFTTKGERGSGLGLAMVYGIAQRHNAEMEIESAPERGTSVRLVFPPAEDSVLFSPPAQPLPIPLASMHILIVDDDPSVLESLRGTLEGDGHAVHCASGGEDALRAFHAAHERSEDFSVVITDLGMPWMDGGQLAEAIKSGSPATPVILLTGWGQRLAETTGKPANVDHLLAKPPQLDALRATLAQCIARRDRG